MTHTDTIHLEDDMRERSHRREPSGARRARRQAGFDAVVAAYISELAESAAQARDQGSRGHAETAPPRPPAQASRPRRRRGQDGAGWRLRESVFGPCSA